MEKESDTDKQLITQVQIKLLFSKMKVYTRFLEICGIGFQLIAFQDEMVCNRDGM